MEETLRLLIGNLTRTEEEDLGVLLESHFPCARIKKGPERSLNTTKIGANSIDSVSTQARCGDPGQGGALSVGPIWHVCIVIRPAKHRTA